jgi:hypothetical protein
MLWPGIGVIGATLAVGALVDGRAPLHRKAEFVTKSTGSVNNDNEKNEMKFAF